MQEGVMIREIVYSGSFYPGSNREIEEFILNNNCKEEIVEKLRGVLLPHAGWIYSGVTALKGFSKKTNSKVKRVLLIGPSHRVPFKGVATCNYTHYETPLGKIEIDDEFYSEIASINGVRAIDEAHEYEHSLEVQLPFIMKKFNEIKLIPLVAGSASIPTIKKILKKALNHKDIFICISSDLSHYHKYDDAVTIDQETIEKILKGEKIDSESACGSVIINALNELSKEGLISTELIDYRNSGDTAGDKYRVVGYCSMEIKDV